MLNVLSIDTAWCNESVSFVWLVSAAFSRRSRSMLRVPASLRQSQRKPFATAHRKKAIVTKRSSWMPSILSSNGPSTAAVRTRPPRDGWAVAMDQHNRRHGPPPDKPPRVSGEEQVAAFDKTIAPYIAKARANYPAAKRRFEAGLPSGYRFSVQMPLYDRDGTRENWFVFFES